MKNSELPAAAVPLPSRPRSDGTRLDPAVDLIGSRLASLRQSAAVQSIGRTPLVRLRRLEGYLDFPEHVELYLKTEWVNPGGSIKDRTALSIIRAAIMDGRLAAGQLLIDATSGNTGIAYALIGAALEIPVTLVVPESASDERKRTLAAYGAHVVYSDPYEGSDGAIRLVRDIVAQEPGRYFYADQYSNPANAHAHFATTGPEVWHQTHGTVTHFVAALGTTGTLMGAGQFLRNCGDVELVGVQPAEAFHGIEGLKHLPTAIVPAIFDPTVPDRIEGVDTEEAFAAARLLARCEGLLAGSSTGANLAAATRLGEELAQRRQPGKIVAIGCDGGARYLTTGLWATD